ncbi:MAG: VCBS repeat-containing protein [Pirellulales bacterium]|nr:VCBS repeat-containing protein [Pirellulales bacterium]
MVTAADDLQGKLAWYANDGSGLFPAVPNQYLSPLPSNTSQVTGNSVSIGDLDGDGDLDIVAAFSDLNRISWFENDGAGNFSPEKFINKFSIPGNPNSTSDLRLIGNSFLVDLDGDLDLDVACHTGTTSSALLSRVVWYKNDGQGNFGNQLLTFNISSSALQIHFANVEFVDLDHDGDLDITYTGSVAYTMFWRRNNGTGVFGSELTVFNGSSASLERQFADLDGDGDLDLLTADAIESYFYVGMQLHYTYRPRIRWLSNNGTGTFSEAGVFWERPNFIENDNTSKYPLAYAADFDNDDELEVAVVHDASTLDIDFFELVGGTIQANASLDPQVASLAYAQADLDDDGDRDWVSRTSPAELTSYLNDGTNHFEELQVLTGLSQSALGAMATGDLDGDGRDEIVAAYNGTGGLAWYRNTGADRFERHLLSSAALSSLAGPVLADLDGDDDLDVLVVGQDESISWFENLGNHQFAAAAVLLPAGSRIQRVVSGDIDQDGDDDLVIAFRNPTGNGGWFSWFENLGDATFSEERVLLTGVSDPRSAIIADLNGDQHNDIAITALSSDTFRWFPNNGSNAFSTSIEIDQPADANGVSGLDAGDIDNDGDIDLIAAVTSDNDIAWWRNNGTGVFTKVVINTNYTNGISVVLADYDLDGDLDVLTDSSSLNGYWYENQGATWVEVRPPYSVELNSLGDFDGDGDLDILTTTADWIYWRENLSVGFKITMPSTSNEDDTIVLDVSSSTSAISAIAWDLDNDGQYDDATGAIVNFAPGDNGTYPIGLRITHTSGAITYGFRQVTLENVAPEATIASDSLSEILNLLDFTLTATDVSSIDQAADFTFEIDWDGNGTIDETIVGPSGTIVSHLFATAGSRKIRVRATDKDGGTSEISTHTIHVYHLDKVGTDVVFEGTDANDTVEFHQTASDTVEVRVLQLAGAPASMIETFSGITGRAIAKGNGGNDVLNAAALSTIPATLEGGRHHDTIIGGDAADILHGEFVGAQGDGAEGNDLIFGGAGDDTITGDGAEGGKDTIYGGAGNDYITGDGGDGLEGRADSILGEDGDDTIFGNHGHDRLDGGSDNDVISGGDGAESQDLITGGAGDDLLSGGVGRDLLIGGLGSDTLQGGVGEDLLVADATPFDANGAALLALQKEWTSEHLYEERIAHLSGLPGGKNGSTYLVPGATLFDDESNDLLSGGTDLDWFLYNLMQDILDDHESPEVETSTFGP